MPIRSGSRPIEDDQATRKTDSIDITTTNYKRLEKKLCLIMYGQEEIYVTRYSDWVGLQH